MNIAPMLNQSVTWQVGTQNDRGEWSYTSTATVKGRSVPKMRDIIGKDGEVTTAMLQVTTLIQPTIGDKLNGREVITVAGMVTVGGDTVGYMSLTR